MDGHSAELANTPLTGCGPQLTKGRATHVPLRLQVFDYVRASGSAARADITRALDISAGSTTTLTADLIAAGLLREVSGAARETGRGRPPVALQVVPEAAYVIGIKLSYNRHTAVLTDFAGTMLADAALPTQHTTRTMPQLLDEIGALIDRVLTESGKAGADIRAVGIGMPGIIEYDTGTIAWSALLADRDQNLRHAFVARFDMPVYIDNDANMLTLAELWFGEGRQKSDFAVVTIENGVGMGLVLNNRLYRGARGMGLELGHTKVQLDGALCRCGQRGCLEAYLADYALAREAATALGQSPDTPQSSQMLLETLFQRAKSGNRAARTIFERAGRYLSVGLSNVVQLFDPELIILSGERMQYDYLYASEVMTEMQELTLSEGRAPCEVAIHAWGDLVWARGATALALSALTDSLIGGEGEAA
ncbi:XylR family transcriptional regulator [Sulfitobacter alexandrii]|uniref:XylR family transcriptional regulator n=1 Tax=Sulfitobacter alexandrii TaxID=1917485 RepID=A0A1J0WEQ4_9RHOB|nr:ROK family protein [Sulfitobacter alexandrii]APE42799.1 XylR family transcriptional regulator [Sulfitobacter alexandrii]